MRSVRLGRVGRDIDLQLAAGFPQGGDEAGVEHRAETGRGSRDADRADHVPVTAVLEF